MKYSFFSLFIFMQILFIFLHIHKQMQFIKQSFKKQNSERMLVQLEHKKQDLTNQLYTYKNRTNIAQFAQESGLRPLKLNQLKRVAS